MARPRQVVVGGEPMTTEDVLEIAAGAPVRLGVAARTRMTVARAVLLDAVEEGLPVYGATRRLGAGADDGVDDQAAFQRQVIRNHAGGLGEPLPEVAVRAGIAVRVGQLALGGSGARPEVVDALAALLSAGVVPLVPERGSVGMADLVQLAAVAQVLIGEGSVVRSDGGVVPGSEALAAAGLEPFEPEAGEGLAMIATNAFTIGSAALLVARLELLVDAVDLVVALSLEAAAAHRPSGDLGPYSAVAHLDFEDAGQQRSGEAIREHLIGSSLLEDRPRRVQDELSFRCAPQLHGAFADRTDDLAGEVDAALAVRAENPLVDVATRTVVATGNFAQPGLVLALESARLALAHVGQASERRTAVLSALARPLRAEGRAGIPGLLAYTAAEDVVLLRRLAQPVSLSTPVLSEVEDVALWGSTAVRSGHEAVDTAVELLAIEALHAASLLRGGTAPLGEDLRPITARLTAALDAGGDAESLVEAAEQALLDL